MIDSLPKPVRADLVILYDACNRFQSEKNVSDSKFLKAVKEHHIKTSGTAKNFTMYSESVHAKHRKSTPSRLNNNNQYYALVSFLTNEGYMSGDGNISAFARSLCDFYGAFGGSRSSLVLKDLVGTYAYFQKSSWYRGYIQVSIFEVLEGEDINRPIVNIEESQNTGDDLPKVKGVPRTVEHFSGIGFARQNCVYFFMREVRRKVPKMCLIYNIYDDDKGNPSQTLFGITLKGSSGHLSKMHISKIILKKYKKKSDIKSEAISEVDCKKKYPDVYKRIVEMDVDEF